MMARHHQQQLKIFVMTIQKMIYAVDGCSRWSVAGGDDGVLLMLARKTAPTVAVC